MEQILRNVWRKWISSKELSAMHALIKNRINCNVFMPTEKIMPICPFFSLCMVTFCFSVDVWRETCKKNLNILCSPIQICEVWSVRLIPMGCIGVPQEAWVLNFSFFRLSASYDLVFANMGIVIRFRGWALCCIHWSNWFIWSAMHHGCYCYNRLLTI